MNKNKTGYQNNIISIFIGLNVRIELKEKFEIPIKDFLNSEETIKLDYYLDLFYVLVSDTYNEEEADRLIKSIKVLLGHPTNRHDNPRKNATPTYDLALGLQSLSCFDALFNRGNNLLIEHFLLKELEIISKEEARILFKKSI